MVILLVVVAVVVLLVAAAATTPMLLVRLAGLVYPPAYPRREELLAEIAKRPIGIERFNLAIELVEAALRDAWPARRAASRHAGDAGDAGIVEVLKGARGCVRFWDTGRELRVRFLDHPELAPAVMTAAAAWIEYANLTFRVVEREPADIRVTFDGEGNWSAVGTDALLAEPNAPTMCLSELLRAESSLRVVRTVRHMFGHAIGLLHEHSSPAAEILWDKLVVYEELAEMDWTQEQVDHNIFGVRRATEPYQAFDPESIMMYPIPARWTLDGRSFPLNHELSRADRRFVAAIYPGRAISA